MRTRKEAAARKQQKTEEREYQNGRIFHRRVSPTLLYECTRAVPGRKQIAASRGPVSRLTWPFQVVRNFLARTSWVFMYAWREAIPKSKDSAAQSALRFIGSPS